MAPPHYSKTAIAEQRSPALNPAGWLAAGRRSWRPGVGTARLPHLPKGPPPQLSHHRSAACQRLRSNAQDSGRRWRANCHDVVSAASAAPRNALTACTTAARGRVIWRNSTAVAEPGSRYGSPAATTGQRLVQRYPGCTAARVPVQPHRCDAANPTSAPRCAIPSVVTNEA
jgi:hypothetical protein